MQRFSSSWSWKFLVLSSYRLLITNSKLIISEYDRAARVRFQFYDFESVTINNYGFLSLHSESCIIVIKSKALCSNMQRLCEWRGQYMGKSRRQLIWILQRENRTWKPSSRLDCKLIDIDAIKKVSLSTIAYPANHRTHMHLLKY